MRFDDSDSLRTALKSDAVVPARVAKEAGLQPGTMYAFMEGRTAHMRADTKQKVIEALRVLYPDLFGDDDHAPRRPKPPQVEGGGLAAQVLVGKTLPATSSSREDDVVVLPMYDVNASAGPGSIVEDGEPIGYYPISLSMLQSLTRAPAEMVGVIQVRGDSMEPDLRHGDLIFVDRTVTRLAGDFIYVLDRGGYTQVKILQAMHSSQTIKVKSANGKYDDDEVTEDQITIAGKVVAVFRGIG